MMETESLTPNRIYRSDKLHELVTNTACTTTFLFCDRKGDDLNVRKCHSCSATLKPNDPCSKVDKCGHIYHTDCYVKHIAVIAVSNSPRRTPSVTSAIRQLTPTDPREMSLLSGCGYSSRRRERKLR